MSNRRIDIGVDRPPCLGHRIIVAADGHIALADHDIRAERAVVALGGDASPCYRLAVAIMTGDTDATIGTGAWLHAVRVARVICDRRDRDSAPPVPATRRDVAERALRHMVARSATAWLRDASIDVDITVIVSRYRANTSARAWPTRGQVLVEATWRDAITWWRSGERGPHLPGGWTIYVAPSGDVGVYRDADVAAWRDAIGGWRQ